MHEQQRFAVALAGIGGCLCLAAGIVFSGPRGLVIPGVDDVPVAQGPSLPRLPLPSWLDTTRPDVPEARGPVTRGRAIAPASRAETITTAPLAAREPVLVAMGARAPGELRPATLTTDVMTPAVAPVPLMLSTAPLASGIEVVVADKPRDRSVVTGAFVTAGTHVGESFKTVGRTLKRVF